MGAGYNPYRDPKTGQFMSGAGSVPVDYEHSYDVKNAVVSTAPEKDGARQFPTYGELIEHRRELEIERRQEEAKRLNEESKLRDREMRKAEAKQRKIQAVQQEIDEWERIWNDPHSSDYLFNKAKKELLKLRSKLKSLQ